MKRLAKMLLGAVLAVFALLIPATPANGGGTDLIDITIDETLNMEETIEVTVYRDSIDFLDGEDLCELLENPDESRLGDISVLNNADLLYCDNQGGLLNLKYRGRSPDLSARGTNTFNKEVIYTVPQDIGRLYGLIDSTYTTIQIAFPGNIKSVKPNIGDITGKTWLLNDASKLTSPVIITAARYDNSNLEMFLKTVIPLTLIVIAAVVVAVTVSSFKKKSQKGSTNKPGGSAVPPPSPVHENPASATGNQSQNQSSAPSKGEIPGKEPPPTKTAELSRAEQASTSAEAPAIESTTLSRTDNSAVQAPTPSAAGGFPGHPSLPEAPEMSIGQPVMPIPPQPPLPGVYPQGGYPPQYGYFPPTPYPPNVPPQTQPGAPMPGGNYPSPYPYPYPYPPSNPQYPGSGYYPMPNQDYGVPAPGFPPPQAPTHPEQSAPGVEEENGKESESGR